jgi:hypothetical protein
VGRGLPVPGRVCSERRQLPEVPDVGLQVHGTKTTAAAVTRPAARGHPRTGTYVRVGRWHEGAPTGGFHHNPNLPSKGITVPGITDILIAAIPVLSHQCDRSRRLTTDL